MKLPHRILIVLFFAACIGALGWSASHYYDKYRQEQKRADSAENSLRLANATITDMQVRQRDVAALDARYTKELADAKSTISHLERDVAAGKRRLYLNATCTGKADTAASSGLVNAPAASLTPDAERDYWRLRAGIETVTKQVEGLQEYIRGQCLK